MTIDAWALDKAIRRHWFRCRRDEGVPLPLLEPFTRNAIVAEALEIQRAAGVEDDMEIGRR